MEEQEQHITILEWKLAGKVENTITDKKKKKKKGLECVWEEKIKTAALKII